MDKNVLHNISYGMYVVSSFKDDLINGQIVNTLFQVASNPSIVAISINKENLTHEFIKKSGKFAASILSDEAPLKFIGKFGFKSGRIENKFKDIKFRRLASGCPIVLDYALCYLEARVINEVDCGSHSLFLGEVTDSEILKEGKPMTYAYYHHVKKGLTPKNAPTFIKEERRGDTSR